MEPIRIYGKSLFKRALNGKIIRHLNNAPGGVGGVDNDVQFRLGANGSDEILDRRHGICCGIVITWIIGFCNGRPDAKSCISFESYFMNTLRFQGAYLKDQRGNVNSIDDLSQVYTHGLSKIKTGKCQTFELTLNLPNEQCWGGYLGVWHHAVGIGRSAANSYFIMDPNVGLLTYSDATTFNEDVKELCEARRVSKGQPIGSKLSYTFFKRI